MQTTTISNFTVTGGFFYMRQKTQSSPQP